MSQKPVTQRAAAEKVVKKIRRATRKRHSAEEKMVLCCDREVPRKDKRRVEMALKIAHVPCARELNGFDFAAAEPRSASDPLAGHQPVDRFAKKAGPALCRRPDRRTNQIS